jgi:hypothetical protein
MGEYKVRAIADHVKRDPGVISRGVRRVEKRLLEDGVFRQSMEKVEKSLIRGKKFKIV